MAKLTTTDLVSGAGSATVINDNFALVEAAVEKQLTRDGTTPNSMSAQLDMGTNKIINVVDPTNNQEAATKKYADDLIINSAFDLDNLSNVVITGPLQDKDALLFDSGTSKFVDRPIVETDISDLQAYLTSDAPATVSNVWTFTSSGSATPSIKMSSIAPVIFWNETDAGIDEKNWEIIPVLSQLRLRVTNDAGAGFTNALTIDRTGTVIDAVNILAPLTATSYGGTTEANLLDKTAAETITGAWLFDARTKIIGGNDLRIQDAGNDDFLNISHSGSLVLLQTIGTGAGAVPIRIQPGSGNWVGIGGGGVNSIPLRLLDGAETSFIDLSHDSTDFNIAGTGTTDLNITGITSIQAGTVDADFNGTAGAPAPGPPVPGRYRPAGRRVRAGR